MAYRWPMEVLVGYDKIRNSSVKCYDLVEIYVWKYPPTVKCWRMRRPEQARTQRALRFCDMWLRGYCYPYKLRPLAKFNWKIDSHFPRKLFIGRPSCRPSMTISPNSPSQYRQCSSVYFEPSTLLFYNFKLQIPKIQATTNDVSAKGHHLLGFYRSSQRFMHAVLLQTCLCAICLLRDGWTSWTVGGFLLICQGEFLLCRPFRTRTIHKWCQIAICLSPPFGNRLSWTTWITVFALSCLQATWRRELMLNTHAIPLEDILACVKRQNITFRQVTSSEGWVNPEASYYHPGGTGFVG